MTHAKPSDGDLVEPDDIALALGRVDAAHRRMRTRIARSIGLAVADLTALLVISDARQITPTELATELGHTSGTITALIDRLTAAGQVARIPKEGDRRSVLVVLTSEGDDTVVSVWQQYARAIAAASRTAPHLVDRRVLAALHAVADAIDSEAQQDATS